MILYKEHRIFRVKLLIGEGRLTDDCRGIGHGIFHGANPALTYRD
jgi:hypothetical protein